MDEALLLRGVLGSVLGGRTRKRSRRALRFLTGRQSSMWSSPTTLLAAAGVAWGIYDTLTNTQPAGPTPSTPPGAGGFGGSGGSLETGPPGGLGRTSGPLPPLPGAGAAPAGVSEEALRLMRLAISAANADGLMNDHERAAVIKEAQAAGVAPLVEVEFQQRRPLAEIVAGVSDEGQRAALYALAFTILRADEQLTGAERIYLAQLAHLLHLDRATVETLERDVGARIDALGDQPPDG